MGQQVRRRGPGPTSAALALAALLFACVSLRQNDAGESRPAPRMAVASVTTPITLHPPFLLARSRTHTAVPARLLAPTIGIDTRLLSLGLTEDGAMEVPDDAALAGWYEPGPVPGSPGPAVIAGHVDSRQGPGVFAGLAQAQIGDRLTVIYDDDRQFVFTVSAVEQHPKDALPVARIWADSDTPLLRLITCGGRFNRRTGHYSDNVVVYAELLVQPVGQAI